MKRVIICILTVTLLIGALAVPSYAADFDNDFGVQVLDYDSLSDDGSNFFMFYAPHHYASYTLPEFMNVGFVDVVFKFYGSVPQVVCHIYDHPTSLNVISIGNGYFRAYGHIFSDYSNNLTLEFISASDGSCVIESFKVYRKDSTVFDIPMEAQGYYDSGADLVNFDLSKNVGDSRPTLVYMSNYEDFDNLSFAASLFSSDWKKFDFIDFSFVVTGDSINSISANLGEQSIPFTVNTILHDGIQVQNYVVTVRLDLRGLDRTLDLVPEIFISGTLAYQRVNVFSLDYAVGYVVSDIDPFAAWFRDLRLAIKDLGSSLSQLISGFRSDVNTVVTTWSDIINKSIESFKTSITSTVTSWSDTINKSVGSVGSKIDNWGQQIVDALVGQKSDDTTVSDAIQNQEQVNQEVNSQLQSAVGSWSDNVGEVTQGFNLALTNATPALIWISGMAQNVFSGMGWFGNIFFFLGFLHVFFLLMSKSGLGRAIDRADKRGDD